MKRALFVVVCSLLLLTGCMNNSNDSSINNQFNHSTTRKNETKENDVKVSDIKVMIHDKEYSLKLEDNETVNEFMKLLPQEFTMT